VISSSRRIGLSPVSKRNRMDKAGEGRHAGIGSGKIHRDLQGGARPGCGPRDNASRKTHSPIAMMRPLSSASGMKALGSTNPRVGCAQRTSALEADDFYPPILSLRLVAEA